MTKILIVDDDIVICSLLSDFLSINEFEVEIADSATRALESIKSSVPGLVLADFQMPDMNGADLLGEIRSYNATLPVLIMSGNSDTQSIVEAHGLKANAYIQKPFSPKEVLEVVKGLVNS